MAAANYSFDSGGGAPVKKKTTSPYRTSVTPGGYDPSKKAPAGTPTGNMYSGGTLTSREAQTLSDFNNYYTDLINNQNQGNQNPYGGVPGGGGGSGVSRPDYSAWLAWATGAKPKQYNYTPLDLPEYNAPDFYDFDTRPYDTAKTGIQTGIADSRQRGNTAFDLAARQYLNYRDPYAGGPRATNPGVDPRLMASMEAWGGAGSGAAADTYNQGVQADSAMGSVYDLLGKVGRQYNTDQLAGVEGDRMQFDQRLGSEERMLNLGVDMALARARSEYERELWQYGKEEADRRFEMKVAEATANNQGINQANQFNVTNANQWNAGILDQVLEMIASQGRNIPTSPGSVYA